MGEKEFEKATIRLEDWAKLKAQLTLNRQSESYPSGWAGDLKELKRKQALWNAENPDAVEEEEMDVKDTNVAAWKQVPARSPLPKLSAFFVRERSGRLRVHTAAVRTRDRAGFR
jgi:hypothetical protein